MNDADRAAIAAGIGPLYPSPDGSTLEPRRTDRYCIASCSFGDPAAIAAVADVEAERAELARRAGDFEEAYSAWRVVTWIRATLSQPGGDERERVLAALLAARSAMAGDGAE